MLRPLGEQVDRILVVDDDRDFARLVTRMLDHPVRRYQVYTADKRAPRAGSAASAGV